MSLQWTLVATFLYMEFAFIILLLLPLISPTRWQKIFKSRLVNAITSYSGLYFNIILFVLILFFGDSIREMIKYKEILNLNKESANHNQFGAQVELVKELRAQRNFHICGTSLFLWFVIKRLIVLISDSARFIADSEASKKQALSATRTADQLITQSIKEKQKKQKLASSEESESETKDSTSELIEQCKVLTEQLRKAKIDLETMKSQAENVTKEYDNLLKEHAKIQSKLEKYENSSEDKNSHKRREDSMQFFEEDDLPYEEECIRNPYNVKSWLRYIDHKQKSKNPLSVYLIYERSLKLLSGSYKLWYQYLKYRRQQIKHKCIDDKEYDELNHTYERSLSFMHKMPRIWLDYCEFLLNEQCLLTRARKTLDKALRSLPITQHHRIWPLYIKLVETYDIPDTGMKVYKRYLKLTPENTEDYVEYLRKNQNYNECAQKYMYMLNTDEFKSKHNKTKHQLWHELCDLISKNSTKINSINVEAIFRQGIERYKDQVGQLWNSLASYYIGLGNFERARDVYEEGMTKVITVRDFTQIFDAYSKFEEEIISDQMEQATNSLDFTDDDDLELEIHLARLEYLMDRRPLLLNRVLLRQNPHNVQEWLKRVGLYEGKPREIIDTFKEALEIVDAKQATGNKYSQLWIEFAKYYERNNQLEDARLIYDKATKASYKNVDDLALVWCEWCEMELRNENHLKAIKLMERATQVPKKRKEAVAFFDQNETAQSRLHKSLKLWSMYVDLEESFGSFNSCKAVYEKIIELRIATPQIIINFSLFLEENNYYEEAFRVYEKGISLFRWPNVYDIWLKYLTKFIERYEGTKLERLRDLFEQCLENCPKKYNMEIFLLYAKLEVNHGLARRALKIYERACDLVAEEHRYEMFNIYIKQAASMKGVTATREIFEKSMDALPDEQVREMGMRYADMERKLGEIDRARAIYVYVSQLCDPRSTQKFWQQWKEFEVAHGNEDTMREMLRIKRSVQATYNVQVNFMSASMVPSTSDQAQPMPTSSSSTHQQQISKENEDPMSALEAQATKKQQHEATQKTSTNKGIMFVRSNDLPKDVNLAEVSKNPDEIQLEDLNLEEGEKDAD